MATVEVPRTFGAILLGGLYASLLSGIVVVQVIMYFKLYPSDTTQVKSLVLIVWLLDTSHTAFIWSALWSYLIDSYGQPAQIDIIHWNIALTIVMTAILTFMVHLFFAHRIFMLVHTYFHPPTTERHHQPADPSRPLTERLPGYYTMRLFGRVVSKRNYLLTTPVVALAVLRLVSASITTAEMLHYGTFSRFREEIKWIFTTGLALSTSVDIIITGSLFTLLHLSRTEAASLNAVIDSLIKYSFETGLLTCAGTVISMICWLTMPTNLIFMGLHFVIGKFYANSLLVTLNMRETIRRVRSQRSKEAALAGENPVHVRHILDSRRRRGSVAASGNDDHFALVSAGSIPFDGKMSSKGIPLEVNVERSIQYDDL